MKIHCADCNKGLAEIEVADPDATDPATRLPFRWAVTATCPYCGGSSFPKTVKGAFSYTGFSEPNPDDPLDFRLRTTIEEEIDEDRVTFKVSRA
jgi:hypothetical protein